MSKKPRPAITIVVLQLALFSGCNDKRSPTPTPTADSASVSVSAPSPESSSAPAPSSTVAEAPIPSGDSPIFDETFSVDARTTAGWGGGVGVLCESPCKVTDKAPRVWQISHGKLAEEKSLWPMGAFLSIHGLSSQKYFRSITFVGDEATLWADALTERDAPASMKSAFLPLRRAGKSWDRGDDRNKWATSSQAWVTPLDAASKGPFPTELESAVAKSPWPQNERLLSFGPGGPPWLLHRSRDQLARWTDGNWSVSKAPWKNVTDLARLEDGRTVVISGADSFVLGTDGSVRRATPVLEAGQPAASLIVADGTPWVAIAFDGGTKVFGPKGDVRMAARYMAPIPAASAAPTTSGYAKDEALSIDAPPVVKPSTPNSPTNTSATSTTDPLKAPVNFTASCSTPFVTLATRPKANGSYNYPIVRSSVTGHADLENDLVFFEFEVGDQIYFGAQATTEKAARALMDLVTANKIKPQLGCLDVRAHVPDLAHPPAAIRVVRINFTTGELL